MLLIIHRAGKGIFNPILNLALKFSADKFSLYQGMICDTSLSHKQNHQILMLEGNSGCLTLGPATCPCSTIAWFGSMEPVRPKKKIFTKCEK